MKIYYRLSDKGRRDNKPNYINLKNCLNNFCKHFKKEDITIIADNIEDSTYNFLLTLFNKNQIIKTKLGNSKSFIFTMNLAIKYNNNNTNIYFIEDDYLHKPNSNKVLLEGLKISDYVTLYDHPDKYKNGSNPYVKGGGEFTKVYLTDSTHWKLTNSTTMTFACKVKTIKQDYITFVKYCQHKIPKDVELFNELIFNCYD